MVKISPLIASMLLTLAAAMPQQGASGTESFAVPTGTAVAFPSGTGGFGGHGGHGGHHSGGAFTNNGAAPTGSTS